MGCSQSEWYLDTVLMIVSGCMWAYVIGNAASVFATLNVHEKKFRNLIDDLNWYMTEQGFESQFQEEIRKVGLFTTSFIYQYATNILHLIDDLNWYRTDQGIIIQFNKKNTNTFILLILIYY